MRPPSRCNLPLILRDVLIPVTGWMRGVSGLWGRIYFLFSFFLSFWKKEESRRGEVIMRLEFRFCKGRGGLKLEVVFSFSRYELRLLNFCFCKRRRTEFLPFFFLFF